MRLAKSAKLCLIVVLNSWLDTKCILDSGRSSLCRSGEFYTCVSNFIVDLDHVKSVQIRRLTFPC